MAAKGANRILTLLQKTALRGITSRTFVTTHQRLVQQDAGSTSDTSNAPLAGIRVLDMGRILAGPYCTMILGDLGAEVLKIERPGCGDDTRTWGPPFVGDESAYFFSINRNKKSVTVNVKSEEGCNIIKELAKKSDVFVENYLPGKLEEMGLGYKQLSEINPRLVYCSITGYGQDGPYMSRAGYDVLAAGMGGLMHITGPEDGEPCRVGVAMTDLSTGLYAYGAIMAALLYRHRTNRGQHIDCNLLSTQVATLTHIGSNYLNCNMEARRYGNGHGSIVPYQAFKTADSHIIIGCGNNHLFKVFCESMDLEHLLEDDRYKDNADRVENRGTLIPLLSDIKNLLEVFGPAKVNPGLQITKPAGPNGSHGKRTFRIDCFLINTTYFRFVKKSTKEWLKHFEGCPFPYGPINNMEEVFSNEQVINNGLIQEMNHTTQGQIRVPGPAVRYSGSDVVLQGPPPTLGQHTNEVLTDVLNMSQDEINTLRSKKVL